MSGMYNPQEGEKMKKTIELEQAKLKCSVYEDAYGAYKGSIGVWALTIYGFALIAGLLYIGISSNWAYFNSGNILLFALIIASYPVFGILLSILEVVFEKEGVFKEK